MTTFYTNHDNDTVLEVFDGIPGDRYLFLSSGFTDFDATGVSASQFARVFVQDGLLYDVETYNRTDPNHWQRVYTGYDNEGIQPTNQFLIGSDYSRLPHGRLNGFQYDDGFGNRTYEIYVQGKLSVAQTEYADTSFTIQRFNSLRQLEYFDIYHFDGSGIRTNLNSEFHFLDVSTNTWFDYNFSNPGDPYIAESAAQARDSILFELRQQRDNSVTEINPGFAGPIGAARIGLDLSGALPKLIVHDWATLIGHDGATLIGHDGATLIGQDGAGLIGDGGGTFTRSAAFTLSGSGVLSPLIGHDGATLIGHDGATLIGDGGGTFIGQDGASIAHNAARVSLINFANTPAALIGDGGGTFASKVLASFASSGHAVDSYLADALAFIDTNRNGLYDHGEEWDLTDANGVFELLGAGSIVVAGGTDLGTAQAFAGLLEAPTGSDVVTPLTTILNSVLAHGGSLGDANAQMLEAFGLDPSLDLTSHDFIAGLLGGDAASKQSALTAFQIINTIVMSAYALNGAGVELRTAARELVTALGTHVFEHAASGQIDLSQPFTILGLFGFFGQSNLSEEMEADGNASADSLAPGFADALATLIGSANGQLAQAAQSGASGAALLSLFNEIQIDAQGGATLAELRAAGGDPAAIAAIQVGSGGTPTPTPDPTDPTPGAPSDPGRTADTVHFDFKLTDATIAFVGNLVVIDGPSSHTVLRGTDTYVFTDGTVNNKDGDALVDDLFYYSQNHDVWTAHADADAHYHTYGWHEGRDPDPFFSTTIFLWANPDVRAANVDPLIHFDQNGWKEGRVPSLTFDPKAYLAANPDVNAAHVDPLKHFLQFGAQEGRRPIAPSEVVTTNGFDFVYYLQHNPDVAAAHVDPFEHFATFGWKEGRNPNALFDTNGYLTTYTDVTAAQVNPLDHYHQFGWIEGRDPSAGFDTTDYLGHNADVQAAHVDPLVHFLQVGIHEGRLPFADGVLS